MPDQPAQPAQEAPPDKTAAEPAPDVPAKIPAKDSAGSSPPHGELADKNSSPADKAAKGRNRGVGESQFGPNDVTGAIEVGGDFDCGYHHHKVVGWPSGYLEGKSGFGPPDGGGESGRPQDNAAAKKKKRKKKVLGRDPSKDRGGPQHRTDRHDAGLAKDAPQSRSDAKKNGESASGQADKATKSAKRRASRTERLDVTGEGGRRQDHTPKNRENVGNDRAQRAAGLDRHSPARSDDRGQQIFQDPSGFGFRRGEWRVLPAEFRRFVNGLPDDLRDAMMNDPKTVVEIEASSSWTGTEKFNLDLSIKRAESTEQEFRELGVVAEIHADGIGEVNREPSIDNVPDDPTLPDHPEHRFVVIRIIRPQEINFEETTDHQRSKLVDQLRELPTGDEIRRGQVIFDRFATSVHEAVREELPMDSTWDNAKQAGKAVWKIGKNVVKLRPLRAGAEGMKYVGQEWVDMRKDMKEAPRGDKYYAAAAAGYTDQSDGTHQPPKDEIEAKFYEMGWNSAKATSASDKALAMKYVIDNNHYRREGSLPRPENRAQWQKLIGGFSGNRTFEQTGDETQLRRNMMSTVRREIEQHFLRARFRLR